jgi:hypothetical protein
LAFHTIALSTVDTDFAKEQLDLMLQEFFLHPTGQIPAYEWNFGDVNPPVHAWATIFLYRTEQALKGEGDLEFLRRSFAKLVLNFSWWVNRKDRFGKNLFEGGFLGLDNIGVFDRSSGLGASHQTGWTGVVAKLIELTVVSTRNSFWMPGKQAPLRRVNPRRSGRVWYAGFLASLQGTVLSMELPGGLATIDRITWHSKNQHLGWVQ